MCSGVHEFNHEVNLIALQSTHYAWDSRACEWHRRQHRFDSPRAKTQNRWQPGWTACDSAAGSWTMRGLGLPRPSISRHISRQWYACLTPLGIWCIHMEHELNPCAMTWTDICQRDSGRERGAETPCDYDRRMSLPHCPVLPGHEVIHAKVTEENRVGGCVLDDP